MSVASGLSPFEVERVATEAPELLDAMSVALGERWTTDTELLAGIHEQQQATNRLLAQLGGTPSRDLPNIVRIPRPSEKKNTGRKTATGGDLAAWVKKRRGGA